MFVIFIRGVRSSVCTGKLWIKLRHKVLKVVIIFSQGVRTSARHKKQKKHGSTLIQTLHGWSLNSPDLSRICFTKF